LEPDLRVKDCEASVKKTFLEYLIEFLKSWFLKPTTPKPTPTPTPTPTGYKVVRGQRVEVVAKVPCKLEFDITGMKPTSPSIEAHLSWAVATGHDWDGGNPKPTKEVYACSAKDYKLKCNGFGERDFYGPAGQWDPAKTYHFALQIGKDMTTETISLNGTIAANVSVSAPAPAQVWLGYGWPPSIRNGAEGVVLTNIKLIEL
jgi:hypothetical protein